MNLKTKFLASVRPFFDAEKENGAEKTPQQIERDKIKVTSGGVNKEEQNQEQEENKEEENNDNKDNVDKEAEGKEEEAESEEDEEGDESEEGKENEEDDGEAKELTPEQKQIKALERKVERLQKRVGKTAGERDQIKKDLKDAKAALEKKIADGDQPLTEDEVNRRAKDLAEREVSEREFSRIEAKLIKDATKADPKFISKVNEMAEEVGAIPPFFISALGDLDNDNGGAVLNYLSDNHDEYEDLLGASNAMKVMQGLIKISDKLAEAGKPKPKKISNAPEPPKAPKGNAKSPDGPPPNPTKNMKEFVAWRNREEQKKREARK